MGGGVDERDRFVELECEILRALCQTHRPAGALKTASEALRGYAWRHGEHGVVFEALQNIPSGETVPLRERLAAQATLMGFPDVDWARYLDRAQATQNMEQFVRNLSELAGSQ